MNRGQANLRMAGTLLVGAVAATPGGCGSEGSNPTPTDSAVYDIALTVSGSSSLPACTPALAGEVAYVASPPGLVKCLATGWTSIPCASVAAGAVAYASTSKTLVACVDRRWTIIDLPPGPQGPSGSAGMPGATSLVALVSFVGASGPCASGGTEVETGVDVNADGQLESSEVTATSYVCSGDPGAQGPQGPPGPQGPAGPQGPQGTAASQPVIELTSIPPGPVCPAGGTEIAVGHDNVLTQFADICNGVSAAAGADAGDGAVADAPGDDASDAPVCGQVYGACCTTGAACLPPNQCQGGLCAPCGGAGAACCPGQACSGFQDVCFQGTCQTCGIPNGPCCPFTFCVNGGSPGSPCGPGYACTGSTCTPCGTRGLSCCTDRTNAMTRGIGSCGGALCTDGSTCNSGPLACQ